MMILTRKTLGWSGQRNEMPHPLYPIHGSRGRSPHLGERKKEDPPLSWQEYTHEMAAGHVRS